MSSNQILAHPCFIFVEPSLERETTMVSLERETALQSLLYIGLSLSLVIGVLSFTMATSSFHPPLFLGLVHCLRVVVVVVLTMVHGRCGGIVRPKAPAVIVFGDSTVDPGNNNQISTVLKSNFEPYGRDMKGGATGRFSNGRIPTDFISEDLGIKPLVPAYLDPKMSIRDFTTGVSFASAGTGLDNATSNVLSVIPLWKELEYFKEYKTRLRAYAGPRKANTIIHEAVYIISIGTNDFLENYYLIPQRSSRFTVKEYQVFLAKLAVNFVKELYSLGARKISFGGLPPMGCLPLERTTNAMSGSRCVEQYNQVARDYNTLLTREVVALNCQLPGIKLVFSNPYDVMMGVIETPSKYGFDDVSVACCSIGLIEIGYTCNRWSPFTCQNADKYAFWDAFHPTEKLNRIITDYVMKNFLSRIV
ncbi:hypothetical protein AMTRI_Chr10g228680 [Amborella trichopoda]